MITEIGHFYEDIQIFEVLPTLNRFNSHKQFLPVFT